MDLEKVNAPGNNQHNGRINNRQSNRSSNHHHGCLSNNTKMETTSAVASINQHQRIELNAPKTTPTHCNKRVIIKETLHIIQKTTTKPTPPTT